MKKTKFTIFILLASLTGLASASNYDEENETETVSIKMFAPGKGDHAGVGGRGWFVDLAITYDGGLVASGFSAAQLTGPGAHANAAPFPGAFSPGTDERLPGLIVLVSTSTIGARSCQNLANLFNLTGVTNVTQKDVEIWDTWIVGAPSFGQGESEIYVAVAADINQDSILNDAPGIIPDADGNGICDKKDLKAFGVASNIVKQKFFIN